MSIRSFIAGRLTAAAYAIYDPPQEREAIGFLLPHSTAFRDLYKQPYGLPYSHIEDE